MRLSHLKAGYAVTQSSNNLKLWNFTKSLSLPVSCSKTLAALVSLSPDSPTQMLRQSLRILVSLIGFLAFLSETTILNDNLEITSRVFLLFHAEIFSLMAEFRGQMVCRVKRIRFVEEWWPKSVVLHRKMAKFCENFEKITSDCLDGKRKKKEGREKLRSHEKLLDF